MKLETIVNGYQAITKLFDGVTDFERKWKLVPAYTQVKNAVKMHDDEKNKLVKKYGGESGEISGENVPKFTEEYKKLIDSEIELKPLKFDKKDAENGNLTVSEIVRLSDTYLKV